jgi:hypothetical protein
MKLSTCPYCLYQTDDENDDQRHSPSCHNYIHPEELPSPKNPIIDNKVI